jgi:hypothetical protein
MKTQAETPPVDTRARKLFIKIRVTPVEREAVRKRAKDLGVSISDLIRQGTMGTITVRAIDSDAAFELRRLGAMLKSLYPKGANWTNNEKRRYWQAMETILGYAEQLSPKDS